MGWPKGRPRPAETRAKISAAKKAALADPAVRAKMSAASKAAWADPAVRAKISAAKKAALADPAVRAKMSAARKAAWADPAVRAKMDQARVARRDRRCVYCGHSGYGLIPDGKGVFACRNEDKCEDRILRAADAMAAAS